jgi:hypothetical protein
MTNAEADERVADQLRPATIRFWRGVGVASRLALAGLASAWIVLGAMDVASTVRASRWPTVTGTMEWVGRTSGGTIINVSRMAPTPHGTSWVGPPELRYRYVVGADTLSGWRANVTQPTGDGFRVRPRAWFDQWLSPRMDKGSVVTVHYDPRDARQSALSVSSSMATWVELAAGIAILIALARSRAPGSHATELER